MSGEIKLPVYEFLYDTFDMPDGENEKEAARVIGAYVRGDRYVFHKPVSGKPEAQDFGCYLLPPQRAGLIYPIAWAKFTGNLEFDWIELLKMFSESQEIKEQFAFRAGQLPKGDGFVWTGRFLPKESRLVDLACSS